MPNKKIFKTAGIATGLLFLLIVTSNFIWINENENLFYKFQQYLTYSKEDWANYEKNKSISLTDTSTTDVAVSAPDLYPCDTSRLSGSFKEEHLRQMKNAHFEKLTLIEKKPLDEQAQAALIRLTKGRLTDVIIKQNLNIKIGKCYENPNKEGNFNCMSCMILLYNREKKDWQEAPEGENFLANSYDFYQPSENDIWEAKDLSMMIPYDYELIKKYEAKQE